MVLTPLPAWVDAAPVTGSRYVTTAANHGLRSSAYEFLLKLGQANHDEFNHGHSSPEKYSGGFFRENGLYIYYARRTILDEYTTVEHC